MAMHAMLTRRTPCCRITGGPARPPPPPRRLRGIRCKLKMYPSAVVTCTQPIRQQTRSVERNGVSPRTELPIHTAHAQTRGSVRFTRLVHGAPDPPVTV
jgi:hypothetical protein